MAEELSRHMWGDAGSPVWLPELLRIAQSGFRAAFEEFRSQAGSSVPSSEEHGAIGDWLGGREAVFPGEGERHDSQGQTEIPLPQFPLGSDHPAGVVDGTDERVNAARQESVEPQHFGEWLDWDASLY